MEKAKYKNIRGEKIIGNFLKPHAFKIYKSKQKKEIENDRDKINKKRVSCYGDSRSRLGWDKIT